MHVKGNRKRKKDVDRVSKKIFIPATIGYAICGFQDKIGLMIMNDLRIAFTTVYTFLTL